MISGRQSGARIEIEGAEMNKVLKVVGGLALLYVVVMGGSGLAIRAALSSSFGEEVRERLQARLPVEASIGGGDFDIAEWFMLRPAITFVDLRIENPDGFSAEPLLRADRVAARAQLSALFNDEVRIHTVEIDAPAARIESDAGGRTNLEALLKALQGGGQGSAAESDGEGTGGGGKRIVVESFRIRGGSILYSAPGTDDLEVRNLALSIENFAADRAFDLAAELDLFPDEAIHLSFVGTTGPFQPKSSPAAGRFEMEGRLGRLPEKFRRENLGAFLAAPGDDSRLMLEADLEGDLLGVLTGVGEVRIADVMLGDPQQGQLPLNGQAPVLLTLIDPVADPSFQVVMPDASLQLGAGTWQGGVDVQYDAAGVRGKSAGAIRGVDVNQILSSFTPAGDTLFGAMAIERYELNFAGRDADEIVDSLNGSGRIDLTDGKLAVFDAVGTIEQHLNKLLGGDQPASGVTSFVRFGTDFEIRGQRIHAPNLLLENEAARIGGAGSLGFDESLDFDLSSLVSGALAQALGARPNTDGVAQAAVPLDVSGSLSAPKVRPDLKRLAQKAAVDQARSILDSLFNKKGGEEDAEGGAATETGAAPAAEPGAEAAEPSRPRLPLDLGGLFRKKKE